MPDRSLTVEMTLQQKIAVLKQFYKRISKEKFINNQSSEYYSSQNSKFVIPGILITGLSSVVSFIGTSDMLSNSAKSGFGIGVGIFTAAATILQSISSSFGFQSRAEGFQKAADSYDTLLTKVEFEISNPNEDFNDFCNGLEDAILEIKNDCKYLPPLFIYDLWEQNKDDVMSDFDKNSLYKQFSPQQETQQQVVINVDNDTDTTKNKNINSDND
jgi:hypothetical protein